jgi:2,3-bisphosphoglycerate-independent phosphoglycerate mutase
MVGTPPHQCPHIRGPGGGVDPRRAWAALPPFAAVTGPWIGTTAGSAPKRPIACSRNRNGHACTPAEAISEAYASGVEDEFLEPVRLASGTVKTGDGLVCFNFRPDRVRQLIRALVLPDFDQFPRQQIEDLAVVTFTQYEKGLPVAVAFPPESLDGLLGQVISEAGLRQFRTAETEKYPHVTYFMNGGIEQAFPGEDRHLVPSPRVATYDQSPAMSAEQLTDSCIAAINKGIYSLVVINYANPDMVGHTGQMEATTQAITTVDRCVGRLLEATGRMGGTMLITADHGNAEVMRARMDVPGPPTPPTQCP